MEWWLDVANYLAATGVGGFSRSSPSVGRQKSSSVRQVASIDRQERRLCGTLLFQLLGGFDLLAVAVSLRVR